MLNVLIVDDEYLQRELVAKAIHWDKLDMKIAGQVEDGKKVMDILQKEDIDIIVMDINIPYINGIEVSKMVKERFPNIQIIILTAYGEFDYARDAVNLGATAFVLKPLNPAELTERLMHAKEKALLDKQKSQNLESLINEKENMEKEQFLLECFSGLADQTNLFYKCEKNSIPYDWNVNVMDMRFRDTPDESFIEEIEDYISEQIEKCEFIHLGKDCLMVLFGKDEEAFKIRIHSLSENLRTFIKNSTEVCISVSNIYREIRRLPFAYREAYSVVSNSEENIMGRVKRYEPISLQFYVKAMPYNNAELMRSLRAREYDEVYTSVLNVFAELNKNNYQLETILYIAMDILISISSNIADCGIDVSKDLEEEKMIVTELNNSKDFQEIKNIVCSFVEKELHILADYKPTSSRKKAMDAQTYIDNNYYLSELSLSFLSDELGVNPSYLSTIFKKEYNCSLSRYIIKVRMEHAADYMKTNPNATLNEVAEEVGYGDIYYFSKSFKNYYGVAPSRF